MGVLFWLSFDHSLPVDFSLGLTSDVIYFDYPDFDFR